MAKLKVSRLLCCLLITAASVVAQTTPQSITIEGRLHPELISDTTAYSLVLSVLSVPITATAQDRATRLAYVTRIGISNSDISVLITIADKFRAQDDADRIKYNASVVPPAGPASEAALRAGVVAYQQARSSSIGAVVAEIKKTLSAEGARAFVDFVQTEKKNMAVSQ